MLFSRWVFYSTINLIPLHFLRNPDITEEREKITMHKFIKNGGNFIELPIL
jgi:hypothetical protein